MGGSSASAVDGTRAAVEHLLHTARRHLRMEAAFLAELTDTEQIHHATTGEGAATFTILEGGRLPRLEGYCRRVMEMDAPWVIRDTQAEPAVRDLAVTNAGRFGAYIGVPVRLPDGSPFGTLCCLSHDPRPDLDDGDVATMRALADVLGFHVAQLGALRREADDLAVSVEEYELRLSTFRHLVDASPNPKLLLDADTLRIVYANRAAAVLGGSARDALIGEAPWAHHACWERDELEDRLRPLRERTVDAISYELVPRDGAPAMDVQAQRVTGEGGPAFILWTGHDVAAHRHIEERLQRALALERGAAAELRRLDGLRNAFLTAVSHELRTPLTTVKGAAETLQEGRVPADAVPGLLDRLRANAQRLDRLLSDLLDLNQFAHGVLRLERETVRIDDLVRDAIAEVDLEGRDLQLRLDEVSADVAPVKVERLVVNLVRNACVHTPPGTPIEVELADGEQGFRLAVIDHGTGVPAEDRLGVFRPFHQGDTAPAHRPGTGIGLSLVAAFAELHGGRVWIEEAPDGGAAFHVEMPSGPVHA